MRSDGCQLMTMPCGDRTRKRQVIALARIQMYFAEQGSIESAARSLRLDYLGNGVTALDIVELLSRLLEGHPPFLLLEVAESFFPQHTFECTLDPVPIRAITADGVKLLYQVAKEACLAEKQSVQSAKGPLVRSFEGSLSDWSDKPHIVNVFREITKDFKRDVFGSTGYITRIMVLTREKPNMLQTLRAMFGCKLEFKLLGTLDKPSPALIASSGLTLEYLSKEGCRELLAQIEYHRRLLLLTVNTAPLEPLEPSNDSTRRLRHSAAYSRCLEYAGTISSPALAHAVCSRTHRSRRQACSRQPNASKRSITHRQYPLRAGTSSPSSPSRSQWHPCGARRSP